MDTLLLARMQFAVTTIYHFFFVPLTLGLGFLVAFWESRYAWRGDEEGKRLAKFWGKLFIINFAMGVVTGLVQEFQFGMNWSEFSRFVGDIFGAPLAVEALLAFFLESVFLGVWIFGWDKIPKKLHAMCMWFVAVGSAISAFWILLANSFMQEPVGFVLRNGRAELESFTALIVSKHLWLQYGHVMFAGILTAAFFVLGISAWHLRREKNPSRDFFMRSFRVATVYALVGFFGVGFIGHLQGQHLVKEQPMKMAAAEALWNTSDPAAFSLFMIPDEENRRNLFSIEIPGLLSFLSQDSFKGEVQGINDLQRRFEAQYGPGDYSPPVALTFWSFRLMVGAGMVMGLLAGVCGWMLLAKRNIKRHSRFLGILVWAMFLPYLANSTGWLLTELGRQPWIIYGVQKTADAISPNVTAGMLAFSLVMFTLLYGALMAADVWLLRFFAVQGPVDEQKPTAVI